jgi:voltage-gated sodium channel
MFYVYAIIGVHLFGGHDKDHFGSLSRAFLTLFQTITLDDWKFLFASAASSAPVAAALYFVSFILLGTMIMLNLFIGIIMNSMEEMHSELDEYNAAKRGTAEKQSALDDLAALDEQVASLKTQLTALRGKLESSD